MPLRACCVLMSTTEECCQVTELLTTCLRQTQNIVNNPRPRDNLYDSIFNSITMPGWYFSII